MSQISLNSDENAKVEMERDGGIRASKEVTKRLPFASMFLWIYPIWLLGPSFGDRDARISGIYQAVTLTHIGRNFFAFARPLAIVTRRLKDRKC